MRNATSPTLIDLSIQNLQYAANKDEIPSESTNAFILAMFPSGEGSYGFNDGNKKEWQIAHDADVKFVVYGALWIFRLSK